MRELETYRASPVLFPDKAEGPGKQQLGEDGGGARSKSASGTFVLTLVFYRGLGTTGGAWR